MSSVRRRVWWAAGLTALAIGAAAPSVAQQPPPAATAQPPGADEQAGAMVKIEAASPEAGRRSHGATPVLPGVSVP
jgi:hypothetical protein